MRRRAFLAAAALAVPALAAAFPSDQARSVSSIQAHLVRPGTTMPLEQMRIQCSIAYFNGLAPKLQADGWQMVGVAFR